MFNATDPNMNQTHVSATDTVFDNSDEEYTVDYTDNMACRLGTSNISAIALNDRTDIGATNKLRIVTWQHNFPPTVDTTLFAPLETTYNTIVDAAYSAGGSVDDIGSSDVTEWGFVYNTTGYPDYTDTKKSHTGTRTVPYSYTDDILDLTAATNYYCRAYACNSSGTGYGDILNSYGYPDYPYTLALWDFEPEQISAGTITDMTGNGHDISFTLWQPNLDITVESIVPMDYAEYTCEGTECYNFWDPDFREPDGYIITPGSVNTPWGEFLPEGTIPERLFWLSALTIFMCALAFFLYKWTRVLLVVAVTGLLFIFAACALSWMGWWVFVMCVILTPGLLLKDESRAPF